MKTAKGYFGLINEYYNKLLANEIILAYDGDISHQVMKAFASMVEEKLENENEDEAVQKKLYHVMVECLQNINRHADDQHSDNQNHYPGRGALLLSKTESHYRLITVNIITKKQVEGLKVFLTKINSLSQEALNELYRKQLVEGSISSKGGAGLGFIDIRRKTGNKMDYEFIKNNDDTSFFLIKITVTRK